MASVLALGLGKGRGCVATELMVTVGVFSVP